MQNLIDDGWPIPKNKLCNFSSCNQLSINYDWQWIMDFAIVHKCWKESELNPNIGTTTYYNKWEINNNIQQFQDYSLLSMTNACYTTTHWRLNTWVLALVCEGLKIN